MIEEADETIEQIDQCCTGNCTVEHTQLVALSELIFVPYSIIDYSL
jgi:hypothetical protein